MTPERRKGVAKRCGQQQERGAWIPPPRADRPDLGASELADFGFCPRSWWLRRTQGLEGESSLLQAGTWAHRRLGLTVAETVAMERIVRLCVGLLLAIAGAVMGLWITR